MNDRVSTSIVRNRTSFLGRVLNRVQEWAADWLLTWNSLSWFVRLIPILLLLSYWSILYLLNGFRSDHFWMGMILLLLFHGGKWGRHGLVFLLPFALTGVIYDSQRFYADFLRGPIHVQEPYLFDRSFFGIQGPHGLLTPNEWWQLHTHPVLDFMTGLAYLVFIVAFIAICAYFYFYLRHRGTRKCSAQKLGVQVSRMSWSFFWVNMVGYSTYYWYPAAPPWYVSLYGLGPVHLDVPANTAGCARFDLLFGTHFFTEMYGRSADVFGAMPSLHVAYPLLAVCFAFQFGAARIVSCLFYLLMCFAAVYLNHHYVLDVLCGSVYAISTWLLLNWICDIRDRKRGLI